MSSPNRRYLVLEDGHTFEGFAFGAGGDAVGEVVFSTSMTGYTENMTDPSFDGQILVQTFPLIGNYGFHPQDFQSSISHLNGYIVKEWCQTPSHFTCMGTLDTFLQQQGVPGLWGIDTRALTKHIRTQGTLRGTITDDPACSMPALGAGDAIRDAVSRVSTKEVMQLPADAGTRSVAVWDFGVKNSTIRCLHAAGCNVTVIPASGTAELLLAQKPDGILLSNGPGDPREYTNLVAEVHRLSQSGIPLFGVGLGHQLMALAWGGVAEPLHYGHRGSNLPVRDLSTGRIYITSQNHGYTVNMDKLPKNAQVRYRNVNDGTCEGLDYTGFNGFSAQFHPEACDALLNRFIANMDRRNVACL